MLIGITGKARAGKDTLADQVIIGMQDITSCKFSFALHVKLDCMRIFDLSHDECFTEKTKLSRLILQRYGTEIRRAEEPDYWIRRLCTDPAFLLALMDYDVVFIPDIRYLNEANFIRQCQGEIWRVVRPDYLRKKIECGETHPSETEMEQIVADYEFINDRSKEDLGKLAIGRLDELLGITSRKDYTQIKEENTGE